MELTREALLDYFVKKLRIKPEKIDDRTALFSSGMIDSFRMVELVEFLERHLGQRMSFGDVNLDNLDSVEKILGYTGRMAAGTDS